MKALLWAMPLLMACGGTPSQQVVKDHEGRVRALVSRVDGKKDGAVRFFAADGALQTIGAYADDSRHGAWTTVSPEGDTLAIVNFNRGRKDGSQAYWAPNGQLLRLEQFTKGEPNGPLYRFFSDGTPRQITWYDRNIPNGIYMEWYKSESTGTGLTMGQFTDGKRSGTWTWLYGNHRVKTQGAYYKGEKVGLWRNWDPQGHALGSQDYGPR